MRIKTFAAFGLALTAGLATWGDYKDDIGYNQLAGEVTLGTGTNVEAWLIEASEDAPENDALVYLNPATFSGKAVTEHKLVPESTIATTYSTHAGEMADYFIGSLSLTPAVPNVEVFWANDWIIGQLKPYQGLDGETQEEPAPVIPFNSGKIPVLNHSYIGNCNSEAWDIQITRRHDYLIDDSGVFSAVGLQNADDLSTPPDHDALFVHTYNALTVGVSSGLHSGNSTLFGLANRYKPELVVPVDTTGKATAIASSSAALLLDWAVNNSKTGAWLRPEVIKAVLMAGATKTEFPDWTNSTDLPIDVLVGAGELNIRNAYNLYTNGDATLGQTSGLPDKGWDYNLAKSAGTSYNFTVPADHKLFNFSVILTWNHEVAPDGAGFDQGTMILNDLKLELFDADTSTLLLTSDSPVDNVEHLYTTLDPGNYTLTVTTKTTPEDTDYALAWTGDTLSTAPANLISAVSRKTHGAVGDFDIPIASDGSSTECRQDGPTYIVVTFDQSVTSMNATVTQGTATIDSIVIDDTSAGITLSGVADQQNLQISLTDITTPSGVTSVEDLTMGCLYGDSYQDGDVGFFDSFFAKKYSGTVTDQTFRYDIYVDGEIGFFDTFFIKKSSGNILSN